MSPPPKNPSEHPPKQSVYAVARSQSSTSPFAYHPPPSKTVVLSSALVVCPSLVRVSLSGLACFAVVVCPTHTSNFCGRIFSDCPRCCNVGLPFDLDALPECSRGRRGSRAVKIGNGCRELDTIW
nr:hypothetical protein Iba_chr04dCG14640 [Ipomoea batatas]